MLEPNRREKSRITLYRRIQHGLVATVAIAWCLSMGNKHLRLSCTIYTDLGTFILKSGLIFIWRNFLKDFKRHVFRSGRSAVSNEILHPCKDAFVEPTKLSLCMI
jgi:hypothetical protein